VNIGGTSMASPQVAGLASLYLQLNPKWNMDQLRTAIQADSKDVIYEPSSTDYDVTTGLQGSGNRMLFNKFGVAQDGTAKNGIAIRNAAINLRK
jgi:subtilisin family serine protease